MAQGPDRATVEALARDLLADVSPAELPLFRATADSYFADPDRALSARGRSDEPLGFGIEAAVTLVGPFALDLVRRVLTSLTDRVGDALAEAVARRLHRRREATGTGSPTGARTVGEAAGQTPSGEPERLDPAQLGLLRQVAEEEARRMQLPPERAQRLADALVASIATRV
ncbi:hypothetical protein [Aquipuribacter sp. MA13-6]|uniref:hypothetical protein n=1 Tax=unclassified Aquipuribacter TaxID=2635084 RepID=UPI003EED3287